MDTGAGRAPDAAATTPVRRVRINPGGAWATTLAAIMCLLALVVLAAVTQVIRLATHYSGAVVGLIILVPSLIVSAVAVVLVWRVAAGFAIDTAGIHGAAQRPRFLPWTDVAALRWDSLKGWGRGNHQFVADLHSGRTVVIRGCRNQAEEHRFVAGLTRAADANLIPAALRRSPS